MAHHLGRARLTAASPPRGPGKTLLGDKALPVGCPTETIVWTVLGHCSHHCGGLAVFSKRFHSPIPSLLHLIESPSISSSLTFEEHIPQSCGADIHSVHSFLIGTRRLIFSAAAWGIHPSPCMGIDASVASPAFNLG